MALHPAATISPLLILTNQLDVGGAEMWVVAVSRWLSGCGIQVIVASSPGELVDRLPPDVRYHPTPLTDVRSGLPLAALRVRRLVKLYEPRLVIANSLATTWVARLATLWTRLPVVEVAHGWPQERYRWVAPLARIADLVIPVSKDVAQNLRQAGLPERKIRVVENGVDLTALGRRPLPRRHEIRALFQAGPEDVVVVNVGRFTLQKAQHRVIEVAHRLARSHPKLRFAIIGYGERENELRDLIARRSLQDRVRLLVGRSDVAELLLASDVYLSCSTWEGMPLATIEAMGAGLPLICSNVAGATALVGRENGFLVPPHDVAAMAAAIACLVEDADLRRQMGASSRVRAEQKFSIERMGRDLIAAASTVVAER
ncbi:MAG: glycosyltransferase [Myxococcota bacterium]